jgi:sphingomyelin phosphodiesterase 2
MSHTCYDANLGLTKRGLKYVAKQRRVRLLAIADWIAKSAWSSSRDSSMSAESSGENDGVGYDVIALQEIWCQEDYEVVSGRAKEAGLLYSRYFYS